VGAPQPFQHETVRLGRARAPTCSSVAAADAQHLRCGGGPRFCGTCGVCADFNACSRTSASTSTRTTRTRFAAACAWSFRLDAKRSSSARGLMIVATPWDRLRSPELDVFANKDVLNKQLEESAIEHWTPNCATFSRALGQSWGSTCMRLASGDASRVARRMATDISHMRTIREKRCCAMQHMRKT
jgi:hypothetical protein